MADSKIKDQKLKIKTTDKNVKSDKKVEKAVGIKSVAKTVVQPKPTRTSALSVPVYSLAGREGGSLSLPKEVFGAKVNQALLSQALRVYMNNAKGHFSHTKSRGQVEGSSRKIYRQKGTGRARHGSIRANIFVGGGVALGPKSRNVVLELPQKMRKAALISALSSKNEEKAILGVSGLERASGKTRELAKLLKVTSDKRQETSKKQPSILIVVDKKIENAQRAVSNLERVDFTMVDQLNAYEVIRHQSLVLTKEAVERLFEKVSQGERVPRVSQGEEKKTRGTRDTSKPRGTSKGVKDA